MKKDIRNELLVELLTTFPQAVSNFGFKSTMRVLSGTLNAFNAKRDPGNRKEKYTLLTFTIYPDLARVWHYFALKYAFSSEQVNIMIVDGSGLVNPNLFGSGTISQFWNYIHPTKIDFYIQNMIRSPYVWLCDDDIMLINPDWVSHCEGYFSKYEKASVVSFAPRGWGFVHGNELIPAMGSYCLVFDKESFLHENLSFQCVRSNNKQVGRGTGYYDTADYANEQLLNRGYGIRIINGKQENVILGFSGTDSARMILIKGRGAFQKAVLNVEPALARYRLTGAYCVSKVSVLYEKIFHQSPEWNPPLTGDEIKQLTKVLPVEWMQKTDESFANVDRVYSDLVNLI